MLRPKPGERVLAEIVRVSVDGGVEGDGWIVDKNRRPGNQVSVINVHVIDSLSGGDPESSAQCGDNLHVDLDLTEANLPAGTMLTIGEVVLEVSTDPHRPCKQFVARFGATGAKKVARANRVGRRGRGLLARVVSGGTIRAGDMIHVKRPGQVCLS